MGQHQINDAFRNGVIHGKNLILDALIDELNNEIAEGSYKSAEDRIAELNYMKDNVLTDGERWDNGTR